MIEEKYVKYPTIENHDFVAFIEKFKKAFPSKENPFIGKIPSLEDEEYAIYEKIDGTNFQIALEPYKDVRFGSRKGWLSEEKDHYKIHEILSQRDWGSLQSYVIKEGYANIRLFGEWYGKNVIKQINYGDEYYFKLFDIMVDDKLISPVEAENLALKMGISDWFIKPIAIVKTLQKSLDFECEFQTNYSHTDYTEDKGKPYQYQAEGIVIKPYTRRFMIEIKHKDGTIQHQYFMLKKKPSRMMEKARRKSKKSTDSVNVNEFTFLNCTKAVFNDYITENRLLNVISKEGYPTSKKDIGKYINFVRIDALEDFKKDYPLLEFFTNTMWKKVTSDVGKILAPLIMRNIKEE